MSSARILLGDCLEQLRSLPDASVQCCVTSPPYFGLRDYGTAEWEGGAVDCDHMRSKSIASSTLLDDGRKNNYIAPTEKKAATVIPYRDECGKCGATRVDQQIGLEATPIEFVARLVEVFREVRRVLKDDGVAWVNMGDSYAGSWGAQGRSGALADRSVVSARQIAAHPQGTSRTSSIPEGSGLKPKDLIGVPWRLAFALQADGWFLRQDVIWHKPNPMPESVTDRCTKAHEYVFLLSKSERYFYDAKAIDEPANQESEARYKSGFSAFNGGLETGAHTRGKNETAVEWTGRRNRRSVWSITTEPYPEAHFATFPTELPRLCILAGSRTGDTILDPFNGSGTTGAVALELARNYIGCELNPDYVALTNRRLSGVTLGLPFEAAA